MDIALTVGSFDQTGGIERVSVQLAAAYAGLGHDITVYATRWDPVYEDRYRFVRVPAPEKPAWLRTLTLPGATAKRLGRHDLVHGQGTSTARCDLLTYHTVHAAWLDVSARESQANPAMVLAKRWWPFHRATIAMEAKQARTHRGLFHTCSRAVRDEAILHYGMAPERVKAIPWGIDLEQFKPDAAVREATRAAWGVGDAPVLLMMANEFNRKGLATVLESLANMARPDVQLVVAGRADPGRYQAIAAKLGLTQQVHFLGAQAAAPCYQAADAFVMPTTYEGWSLVIGEALASGLPVVTSVFAGSSDLITPGQNGLLLDAPRDVAQVTAALATVLDPATRARMAAEARHSVRDSAWSEVGRRLLDWAQANDAPRR